jgi:hypothetical protein
MKDDYKRQMLSKSVAKNTKFSFATNDPNGYEFFCKFIIRQMWCELGIFGGVEIYNSPNVV